MPMLVFAEETTSLTLQGPQQARIPVNELFTINLQIKDSVDVYGIEGHLAFDPAILEVVDMDATTEGIQVQGGTFINPADEYVFVLQNQADNTQGLIDYALALRNPAPAASGDGLLMQITFRPKAEGKTDITITDSLLVSSDVTKVPHSVESLLVNISNSDTTAIYGLTSFTSTTHYFWLIIGGLLLLLSFAFVLYYILKTYFYKV